MLYICIASLFAPLALASDPSDTDRPSLGEASAGLHLGSWTSGSTTLRADWKTFGNGPTHAGYFPDVVHSAPFTAGWTATLNGNLQQVAVAEGRVFVTPNQYFGSAWLTALDESTGSQQWSYAFNNCFSINPPSFDSGKVYVQRGNHGSDTQLFSFHADTGVPFWVAPHAAQWERYLAPTVADGKVWVNGGYYGGMYGFQQSNGQQLFFQASLPQYDQWTPGFYAGTLYSWVAGVLRGHDRTTGSIQWSADLGWNWSGWSMNRTSALVNSRAFLIGNPNLHAIDLSTRLPAWTVNGSFTGTPAVAGGVVYAIAGSVVNSYDAWDGSYRGVYVGEPGLISQPIVTDDAVIFASSTKTFVYDRASYLPVTTIPYGGYLSLANGRLYIASSNGALTTFQFAASPTPLANLSAEWEPWAAVAGSSNQYTSRVTIQNVGARDSRDFQVALVISPDTRFDAGDVVWRLVKLPSLAPGETLSATVELTSNASLAGKYLLLELDSAQRVAETNEANTLPSGKIL